MLTGFTAGLMLITLSELGDKTFFIGAILSMRHPRRWVFLGVMAALFAMTVLSVLLGQVATLFPRHHVQSLVVALFLGFGFKLCTMPVACHLTAALMNTRRRWKP
jgi:putative Ca2+/H+ antiporter (TMEM165/GDT1 family)